MCETRYEVAEMQDGIVIDKHSRLSLDNAVDIVGQSCAEAYGSIYPVDKICAMQDYAKAGLAFLDVVVVPMGRDAVVVRRMDCDE